VSLEMPNMWKFFDELVLHLQRSHDCVTIACTANVPNVPQIIAFCQVARDDEDDDDESERGIN